MSSAAPGNKTPDKLPIGLPEITYPSHAKVSRDMLFGSLAGFLVCGVAVAVGVESEYEFALALLLALAIGLFAAGVYGLARWWAFRARVSVYGNGVLVETRWATAFTRWEDVEAVFEFDPPHEGSNFGPERDDYRCGFSQIDGRTFWFHINRMSALRDFAARLHGRVDELISARTRRVLATGVVVWFGHIGIGRDGVHSHKGVLTWNDVSFAGCVHGTHFDVLKKGSNWGWFSRKIGEVENVAILTEFMRTWREWALLG